MAETVGYPRYTLGPRVVISVGPSPFILQNPWDVPAEVIISGGVVTLIEFSRDGVQIDPIGILGGQFRLNPGDYIRVTYTLTPPLMVGYPF